MDELQISATTDADVKEGYFCFTEMYLHRMAAELAGRKLRLGDIWDKSERPAPHHALFVWSDQGGDGPYPPPAAFVFASARPGDPGSQTHDANDIDCHVSLEVDKGPLGSGMPQLRVRSWMLGMRYSNSNRRAMRSTRQ